MKEYYFIGDLKADKAKLNNDLALLRGEIKQLLKQIEDLGKYNTGNEQVIENLKSEINSLSQRNNELLERCERLRGEVRAKNDALVEATQENKRLENEERARLVLERKILELLCSRSMSLAEITKYLRDEAYVINEREVYKVIQKINDLGTTIVMATHDREMVDKMKKRVIYLENGKLKKDYEKGTDINESV